MHIAIQPDCYKFLRPPSTSHIKTHTSLLDLTHTHSHTHTHAHTPTHTHSHTHTHTQTHTHTHARTLTNLGALKLHMKSLNVTQANLGEMLRFLVRLASNVAYTWSLKSGSCHHSIVFLFCRKSQQSRASQPNTPLCSQLHYCVLMPTTTASMKAEQPLLTHTQTHTLSLSLSLSLSLIFVSLAPEDVCTRSHQHTHTHIHTHTHTHVYDV